jgi:probable O-glycosylation ligase (exosortase A-associated)
MMFGAMFFLVPMALRNPFAAYLIWGWTAFIAIDEYMYGFMTSMRMNLLFALITLVLLAIRSGDVKGRWSFNRTTILLILWLFHGALSAIFSYPENLFNWVLYEKLAKILLFVLLMPLIVYGRYRIHSFVIALSLGLGFHALLEGLKFLVSGGGHRVQGLAKFGDNNFFAVIIIMGMPLLFYLYRQSESRWVKMAALSGAVLTISAVMGTHSRGGLLAMAIAGFWMVLTGRRKLMTLSISGVLIALVIAFAPESWMDRMQTIQTADQDSSFLGRVEAWQISSAIAIANPVLGGGFHAIENAHVWSEFRGSKGLLSFLPDYQYPVSLYRSAHSAYFEVMGDRGLLGFLIFMAILVNAFITTIETRKLALNAGPEMGWMVDLTTALSAVLIAYTIGASGVSLAYAEMLYVVAILAEILKQHMLKNVK